LIYSTNRRKTKRHKKRFASNKQTTKQTTNKQTNERVLSFVTKQTNKQTKQTTNNKQMCQIGNVRTIGVEGDTVDEDATSEVDFLASGTTSECDAVVVVIVAEATGVDVVGFMFVDNICSLTTGVVFDRSVLDLDLEVDDRCGCGCDSELAPIMSV